MYMFVYGTLVKAWSPEEVIYTVLDVLAVVSHLRQVVAIEVTNAPNWKARILAPLIFK